MKLARFDAANEAQLGVVEGERIVALRDLGINAKDMIELIEGGAGQLEQIAERLAQAGGGLPLQSVHLLAPLRPRKFLALGMNYQRHAEEARQLGINVPDNQLWFNKQTSCISGPFDPIEPGVTEKLDYEVELGLVIGKPAKSVKRDRAFEHIFGYLVVNDVSARDWQFHSPTMTIGKSFDTHGPLGPWVVTADEIPNPETLGVRCFVNGEKRQDSNTRDFIHGIGAQIEYLSTAFTLETGDIISTGTPEGVGAAMQPPKFLQPGDVVRCEIDAIGAIENRITG